MPWKFDMHFSLMLNRFFCKNKLHCPELFIPWDGTFTFASVQYFENGPSNWTRGSKKTNILNSTDGISFLSYDQSNYKSLSQGTYLILTIILGTEHNYTGLMHWSLLNHLLCC
jgi:hypothetical protein